MPQVCDLLVSCVKLGMKPDGPIIDHWLQQLMRIRLGHAPVDRVPQLLACMAALGHYPGEAFMFQVAKVGGASVPCSVVCSYCDCSTAVPSTVTAALLYPVP